MLRTSASWLEKEQVAEFSVSCSQSRKGDDGLKEFLWRRLGVHTIKSRPKRCIEALILLRFLENGSIT